MFNFMNPVVLASLSLLLCGCSGCNDAAPKGNFADQYVNVKPTTQRSVDFESFEIGQTPDGFTAALTGGGGQVSWVVQEAAGAPSGKRVLAQTSSDSTDYRFPHFVLKDISLKNVSVSVRFKPVEGKVDRAGGLVVRWKDKDNYYLVRANALEDNVRLYHVVNGDRKQFAGVSAKVSSGEWHTLKLSLKGSHFQIFFDDKPLFEADDQTFKDAGSVGVWTKADSVTQFDDLAINGFDAK